MNPISVPPSSGCSTAVGPLEEDLPCRVRHGQRLCPPLIRLDRRATQTENLGWVRHRGPIRWELRMHRFLVLGLAVTSLCSMSAQAPPAGRPLDWDKLQVEILERYR